MSLRTVRLALATALLLPLLAGPGRANSITTYGVIITAMGNELQVQYVDKPGGDSGTACTTPDAGGKGDSLLVTPDGTGGINISPYGGASAPISTPPGKGATGNEDAGSVAGGSDGGSTGANASDGE